ncbi:MAG TPA: hypothetical protein VMK12_14210, partial [Anaeromyxobacteraceae bacterium]|nr:hypothetical protein [Anaeromyxobacteraceae bacterium]
MVIATGTLLKHVSLGVGKVVAVEPTAVHVFFPGSDSRYAAKLRWPAASALVSTAGVEPNAWLQGLTTFSFDAAAGRYALAANFLSHSKAMAEFVASFAEGFTDPAYLGTGKGKRERASRWRAAHAEWLQAFGNGQGERLVADGEVPELSRRALRVAAHVTCLPGMVEQAVLEEALEPGEPVPQFFEALFKVLPGPPPKARMDAYFAAADALGARPEERWPMATLFPFVAEPLQQVLLLPRSACAAAARLGCNLRFHASPNWTTYAALRELSVQLLEKLQAIGARDFVDVECFLHIIACKRPPAAATVRAPQSTPTTRRAGP